MLTNLSVIKVLREVGLLVKHQINLQELKHVELNLRSYSKEELGEFKRDLMEAGNQSRMIFLDYSHRENDFESFVKSQENPIVVFEVEDNILFPALLIASKRGIRRLRLETPNQKETDWAPTKSSNLCRNDAGEIISLALVVYDSPVSDNSQETEELSPVRRLLRLLGTERKEIVYILFYAILVGFVSLALPLGIQTTVELISGGVIFSSVYLIIGVVILGVLIAGVLQIVQISLVEFLQRRVFAKAALEFAFRIPRLKMEALSGKYGPELVNRFFDVITLQKGLPKLLIDLSSAVIQIAFGLADGQIGGASQFE